MQLPNVESMARQIELKSAVNPCLWLCVAISIPTFGGSYLATDWLRIGLFIVGLIPILMFIIAFSYLLFTKPEFLRSEKYHMFLETLKFFGDKDNPSYDKAVEMITLLNNPSLPPPPSENHE